MPTPRPAPFPPEEFAARRAAVFERIGSRAIAIVQGVGPDGGFELFRQTNEFHYLCGVETPQAYLLLDGRRKRTTLFVPHRDPYAGGEGEEPNTAEDADAIIARTGVDAVLGTEFLARVVVGASTIYTPLQPAETRQASRDTLRHAAWLTASDPWDSMLGREARLREKLTASAPQAEIRDLSPILDDLRLVKSPREVATMRWAGELCGRATIEAMRATAPDAFEYHLAAVADCVYKWNGIRLDGYRPIIANGPNIWFAHYWSLESPLVDGDLVIFDYAPDVGNYTSDIGRMWPVNGRYSPLQRELYGFMVRYHQTLLPRIRAEAMPREIMREAADAMRPVVRDTAWSKPCYRAAAERTLDFLGHLSHPVGMAVHDVGHYIDRPLEVGMTFAVDPQMWIPEEKLYVRVEDTVAVTAAGCEVLTGIVPLDLDAIERLVGAAR